LILAAGGSRRFGAPKLLAEFCGAPLIRRTVEAVLSVGFDELIVVTGDQSDAIAAALEGFGCTIVQAPDWQDGMSASIRAGVAARNRKGRGLFVFLGDMPLAPVQLCVQLAELAQSKGMAARPMVAGTPGHPVCFTAEAVDDLSTLQGNQGAVSVLQGRDVAYLDTEDIGAICDVDTPADLAIAERLWNARFTSATIDNAISAGDLPNP
jgi:molybdenum cofactor cytidylyltransferase